MPKFSHNNEEIAALNKEQPLLPKKQKKIGGIEWGEYIALLVLF